MTNLFAKSVAVFALSAGAALAGGLDTPVAPATPAAPIVPVAQDATDWTGFYLGAEIGTGNAELDGVEDDVNSFGGFAGYMHDMGNIVVGGELAYGRYSADDAEDVDATSLKARVGYDLGTVLPYAFAGVASVSGDDVTDSVTIYGVGADMQVTDSIRVGAEYLIGENDNFDDSFEFKVDTISLRAAYSF